MWRSMEEVMRELKEEGIILEDEDDDEQHFNKTQGGGGGGGVGGGLPPGFRFRPTDEELITCYLASKVFTSTTTNNNNTSNSNNNNNNAANLLLSSGVQIAEVDLTRCEPWDLPERAKMGEREWYLYSLRDRKYPSGLRTNRATETGYWKATGKDRQVYASSITTVPPATASGGGVLIGMKKTLVFYQGRAPRGLKTKWVMHEYRLDGYFSSFRLSSKEEWVICRIFHKNNNGDKKNQAIIIQHPSHSPLPLSPFLSTLPPLQQLKPNTIITQNLAHNNNNNNNNNSLLHSLLSNPLPNFSSISGSHPIIFPPPTTTTTAGPWWLSTTNTTTAATTAATKQQNWLDRIICPQEQIQQYFQHQYHDQAMIHDQTVDIHPLPNNNNNNNDDTAAAVAAVHVDVAAAGALDRMLNHCSYHPAVESWSLFHYP